MDLKEQIEHANKVFDGWELWKQQIALAILKNSPTRSKPREPINAENKNS